MRNEKENKNINETAALLLKIVQELIADLHHHKLQSQQFSALPIIADPMKIE